MITLLNSPIQKFTHILHIADIHIRLNKRHDEYKEVFSKLYEKLKATPDTTLVAVMGDIFHSKSDLSPECVQMASDFFKSLADIRPTILVAGNHDATLSNKSRLDSLTPIVDALNHSTLYYLKTSGLYGFGNILFNNMCVFDPPEKYILGKDIPQIYKNQYEHVIALFHGVIDGVSSDNGYRLDNPAIMTPLFDYYDIALCGDIHLMQNMQEYDPENHKPCIRYCGSLIMQNHGESLCGHGYSLWDLSTHSYTHHDIPNNFGYFTIEVNKGQLTTDLKNIPKKARLRVKCYETIASEIKAVIAKIKGMVQIVETAYVRMDQERDKKDIIPLCKDIVLKDLTVIDYQNRLITEFLQKKLEIVDSLKIEDILEINKNTNALIKKDEFARNLKWKPIRFEWDNMFTYGEGNVIDFTQMNGTYGIFAPNRTGKSSILSALIFCLFDKFDRGFKGMHVLNVQKTSFKCKFEFEISGVRYFIERKGSTTRSGNVKVDVKFWKVVNDVEEELHGTARKDTNDIIRDYIGAYEDFVMTAASFQNAKNNSSFIDMGNSERKDLLVQFIGLNVFDRLHEAANERSKEINPILKLHKDKNYPNDIRQNENALAHANSMFEETSKVVESLRKQIADVNEQIVAETANLIKLDNDVPTNLPALETKKAAAEVSLKQKKEALEGFKILLTENEMALAFINEQIRKIEESNLVESHKIYHSLADRINEVKQKMDLKGVEIKGKLEKVARLVKYEYDPKCKFCVNNAFVKDATKAKEELVGDKEEADRMLDLLESLRTEFAKFQWVEQAYETYTKVLTDRSKVKDECGILSRNVIIATNEMEKLNSSYETCLRQIELYHRNEVSVEANIKVQAKIVSYRTTLGKLNTEFHNHNRLLMSISGKQELFRSQIKTLTKTMKEVQELDYEFDSYQQYLAAVGRDGIPYQVICNVVPEIEREVNSILSQVVDYTIQFDTDGKNVIPSITHSDIGKYPIELSSGFERFISSIAIRVALTEVSSLPRFSALFVDEGMGTLDADNIVMMPSFFTILKNYYDFIFVISHLNSIRDAVDKTIEITREGNFSKVVFE
jgi:DNA repair exonuclease SbcCD ATPase subunit/UDP-2,3-diacylglucosamine pyrophosphatase LpxH